MTMVSLLMLLLLTPRILPFHVPSRLFSSPSLPTDIITSTQSKTIKSIQSLLRGGKQVKDHGETLVEGPRIILDLLQDINTRHLVKQIVIEVDKWDLYAPQVMNDDTNYSILAATPQVLKSCTDTVTNQGIVARVAIPTFCIENVLQESSRRRQHSFFLVTDGLQDPGNLGTLIRSSAATGAAAIFTIQSANVWNPKTVRSAMGTSFQVPSFAMSTWDECIDVLQNQLGCETIYAATMQTGKNPSIPYYEIDFSTSSSSTAVVIGSEGRGLSDAVRDRVRDGSIRAVHLPMQPGVESLNAAVCGSVILFEYQRQQLLLGPRE